MIKVTTSSRGPSQISKLIGNIGGCLLPTSCGTAHRVPGASVSIARLGSHISFKLKNMIFRINEIFVL